MRAKLSELANSTPNSDAGLVKVTEILAQVGAKIVKEVKPEQFARVYELAEAALKK